MMKKKFENFAKRIFFIMLAFCKMFKERCDQYIDQSDALYAYLIEPFLAMTENEEEEKKDENDVPTPSYNHEIESLPEFKIPDNLFEV